MEGPPEPHAFGFVHAAWLSVAILSGALLFLRSRPKAALAILVLMHGGAFLGYYGDLPRTYAVGVSSDRALGVGMAMAVANGGSPYDHVQIEFGNLEPFWTYLVAALSGFSAERVPFIYDRMTLLVITLTALGFYWAWSRPQEGEEPDRARWRGVLVASSILGLSSMSLSAEPPIPHFWHGNFVFKPNHALAFGLVGLLSRWPTAGRSWVAFGLVQALLIWVFILDWAYVLPGLVLAAWFSKDQGAMKRVALGTSMGLILSLPYILHLLKDYSPLGEGEMPQIWRDQMGERLTDPRWWSLDLGLLLIVFLAGLFIAARKRATENAAFGFLLTGPIVALCYVAGLQFGFAPEPDEGFYYWRMVAAAGAGYAVWALASRSTGNPAKRYAVAFAFILAGSFPAYFNPVRDDRYFALSAEAIPPPVQAVADWVVKNTPPRSVLISADGIMLSGLTGRRFLMVRPDQTADRVARETAERDILTSLDRATVERALTRFGVTHVVLDGQLRAKYGDEAVKGLGNRPWFEPMFVNSFARVLAIKPVPDSGAFER